MFLKCMDVIFTSSCFTQLVGAKINLCAHRFQFILSLFGKVKKSFWICESNLHSKLSSRNFWLNLRWIPELSTIGDMLTTRNYILLSRISFKSPRSRPSDFISILKCIEKGLVKAFYFILACKALLLIFAAHLFLPTRQNSFENN